jgi:hypothetical protein
LSLFKKQDVLSANLPHVFFALLQQTVFSSSAGKEGKEETKVQVLSLKAAFPWSKTTRQDNR